MAEPVWTVGFHAVLGLLESDRPVDAVWLLRGRRDRRGRQIMEAARRRGLRVDLVPRPRLDKVAGNTPHNGVAARAAAVSYRSVEDLIAAEGVPGRVLLLDDVTDPHNLGAVLRSAAAFAVDGVVVAGPSTPPLGGTVAKASAGHLDRVPMARATVAADALRLFRDEGYWIFGAEAGAAPAAAVRTTDRWVLCVGAEAKGLRAKTRTAVDELVSIPMAEGVESLNLSVSTGILLYEFCGRGRDGA
jgi:23S rRNA (guanosine2251-2'-O)-methyltransferase